MPSFKEIVSEGTEVKNGRKASYLNSRTSTTGLIQRKRK